MSKSKAAKAGATKPRRADYLKVVEWSEEDGCFVGSAPPVIGKACHGDDEAEVHKALCGIVEDWLKLLERDGKPVLPATVTRTYSGKFILRSKPELHKALAVRAFQSGDSLNDCCVKRLSEAVTQR